MKKYIGVLVVVLIVYLILTKSKGMNNNLKAFLEMLKVSEGTTKYGYYTLVGNTKIQSLDKHPHIVVKLSDTLSSSATGAYQFLSSTWDELASSLNLKDFSKESQDKGAIELIRRKGALNDIENGNITSAINKVRKIWASLPNAGYGQREQKLDFLLLAYKKAGGKLTS